MSTFVESTVERENILNQIQDILSNIRAGEFMTAGASGIYSFTPARVTRENISWDETNGFPTYIVMDGNENISYFGKRASNFFDVVIRCYNYFEKGAGVGLRSTKLNKMIKDVRAALLEDPSIGGYAANSNIINITNDEGWLAPYVVAEISFRVQYLSLELNR